MKVFIEILKAIFLGIVEGITEWLPISSTGHMILVDEFIKLNVSNEFKEMFLVVIQLGAIAAVPVLFWNRLNPFSKKKNREERSATWNLWGKVIVGVLPAAMIGVLLDDIFDKYFYNYIVVSVALIVYGIAFILIEKFKKNNEYRINDVHDLSYKDALVIGAFQVLSLIPGTSRSGSTILGGMLTGVSRVASAEFSFFMAIPVMLGASLLKIVKFVAERISVSGLEVAILFVAMTVSFIVSLFSIKFLMDFVKRHSFAPFGIYRIILGAFVIGYFLISKL
jgi:undecaprenyl-diphosphatase